MTSPERTGYCSAPKVASPLRITNSSSLTWWTWCGNAFFPGGSTVSRQPSLVAPSGAAIGAKRASNPASGFCGLCGLSSMSLTLTKGRCVICALLPGVRACERNRGRNCRQRLFLCLPGEGRDPTFRPSGGFRQVATSQNPLTKWMPRQEGPGPFEGVTCDGSSWNSFASSVDRDYLGSQALRYS